MRLSNPLPDRESEAEAGRITRPGGIRAIKAIEDVRQVNFGDTDTAVLDFYISIAIRFCNLHTHRAVFRRILDRIVNQNQKQTTQSIDVPGRNNRTEIAMTKASDQDGFRYPRVSASVARSTAVKAPKRQVTSRRTSLLIGAYAFTAVLGRRSMKSRPITRKPIITSATVTTTSTRPIEESSSKLPSSLLSNSSTESTWVPVV